MANDDDSSVPQPRGPPPGATAPPDHVTKPQVYEIFESSKSEARDVNNPTSNSPGKQGQYVRPTMSDGISSIKSDDFLKVHQMPCARQGLLTGIGSGFVMGFIRYLTGARVPRAANWAAGGFILGSIVQWEVCRYQRDQERVAMARVVEVIDRKQAEKKQKAEEAAARRRAAAEEKAKQEAQKRWYKFW